jgi:maltooligosyltrehalose trehalohydrolase
LTRRFVYDGRYSAFRRRSHGRPALDVPAERFLGYLQNHDQVGNRACGERIGALVSRERLMIAAALVLTAPFVPMLFQGEEWNASAPFLYFTDHEDPRLGDAVRDGRRGEFAAFGWDPESIPDPQAEGSFRRSRLDWSERAHAPHTQILDWYRRLIALRRAHPDLAAGAPADVRYDDVARWLVCVRGSIVVACNFAASAQQLPLSVAQRHDVLLSSDASAASTTQGVRLAAESVALLQRASFTGDSS